MSLGPGTRLGPYEIVAPIGAGGMGEVYRARDTKLGRDVALKVLPESVAADPERIARMHREAQVLAALNHPNIAAIHGFEDSGVVHALVLEFIDGETLADRIARGAIPVDETLPIAKQIAEALEGAHEQGIIHRDLKPANIKIRPDGTVKVLDFGLAKLAQTGSGIGDSGSDGARGALSMSPTITAPALMSGVGLLLGTAAYMSPEQARGKQADNRSDVWAFGAVLYEMLTGERAFGADDVSDTLAAVLMKEPDWAALPPATPPRVSATLRRCLQKDRKQRARDIGDVRLALEGAFEGNPARAAEPTSAKRAVWRRTIVPVLTCLVGAIGAGTAAWYATRSGPQPVSRLSLALAGEAGISIDGTRRDLAITPDGRRIAYVGNNGTQIFVRALDALEPLAVFTGAPRGVFVSPDGQWIGFVDGRALRKVAMTGGPAVTLVANLPAQGTAGVRAGWSGACWESDEAIVIALSGGLARVPGSGGTPQVLAPPPPLDAEAPIGGRGASARDRRGLEGLDQFPECIPGGRFVLFTIGGTSIGPDDGQIAILDRQTGAQKILVRGGSHAHYMADGHLVYATQGTLRAVAFDLNSLEVHGTPVAVVPDVVTLDSGDVDAAISANGTLAYVSGAVGATGPRGIVWVDREGRETPIPVPLRPYAYPRLSPDGARILVSVQDQELDLWTWDLRQNTLSRLTLDPLFDTRPLWTPDGRRVVFSSERNGQRNLYWQAADGSGASERLVDSPDRQDPTGISPDGGRLIFNDSAESNDIMQLELSGKRQVTPLVRSRFSERNGVTSPDGRWLAYDANDSGRYEIYVRPYPDTSQGRWQVSTTGGERPLWSRNGEELFFVSSTGALMRVGVTRGPSWSATTPSLLIKEGYVTNPGFNSGVMYDVALDGQRFLMIKESNRAISGSGPSVIVVQHFDEELKRLVPTK